ncbi:MAG: hypothetical protein ACRDIB_03945, partial [Ardenticatenaceae bacterium]
EGILALSGDFNRRSLRGALHRRSLGALSSRLPFQPNFVPYRNTGYPVFLNHLCYKLQDSQIFTNYGSLPVHVRYK